MKTRVEAYLITPLAALGLRVARRDVFVDPPILVVGSARSGTTLLLSILGAHPKIFALPVETRALTKWYRLPFRSPRSPGRLDRIYRELLRARPRPDVTCWCEKTPRHVRFLPEILAFWNGRIRIVNIVRDGRDVILSRHPLFPERYFVSPESWVEDVDCGLAFAGHPSVHTLRYEDLILDHQPTMQGLCRFLELDYSEKLRHWQEFTSIRRVEAFRAPVHPTSVGRWRLPEFSERAAQGIGTPGFLPALQALGYETE